LFTLNKSNTYILHRQSSCKRWHFRCPYFHINKWFMNNLNIKLKYLYHVPMHVYIYFYLFTIFYLLTLYKETNNELVQVIRNLIPLNMWSGVWFPTHAMKKNLVKRKELTLCAPYSFQRKLVITNDNENFVSNKK
jgi:hypothetical protein